ncbi:toll-like receptor 3 isoform X2 [Denticeps clupeoides]|nr:toll-like receptor 3 isoform X2 [Denticeps clupeoides]
MWLDVSKNALTSVKLGTRPQLQNLVSLSFSGNALESILMDDLLYLSSSSLEVLKLSSLPNLKKIEPGCFKPIQGIKVLIMDDSKLSPQLTSLLCEELSGTAVQNLSLRNTGQVSLSTKTFEGLNATKLRTLNLADNKISQIEDGSFQWTPQLEALSLEGNNIKHLRQGTFTRLSNLRWLSLCHALVKTHTAPSPVIDDFVFEPLSRLEDLCMRYTAMRGITAFTFSGLVSLKSLDLSWSSTGIKNINNQTFASLAGSPLETLNLTYMAITYLSPGAFSSFGNLTTLLLAGNFISQLLTGSELEGLQKLEKLDFSFNHQKLSLTTSSFIHVPTLKALLLGSALTGSLDMEPSPFHPLVNLTWLDLSNNNIANINDRLLEGLNQLQKLKLEHNNLARLWKDANPGGPVLFLRGLSRLTVLNMDNNGLDEIPRNGLQGLHNLQQLNLSANVLNNLRDSIFADLSSLRQMWMQKNLVTSVTKGVFKPALANLTQLHLERNPYDCTCDSILWFVEWLNHTNASVPGLYENYICNTPPAYNNRSIMDFDPLSCKDMTPFQALYVLSSTVVLTMLVTAFLIHFQGWRIEFYWSVMVSRTLGLRDEHVEEGRYEYDGYVIHAARDGGWVERQLLPLEDEGIGFFLEDRDVVPGCSQLQSIVENMGKSRKIVFVITERLMQDPWCRRFKAHHALHQIIEDSRDSVVLILLQDIQDFHLHSSLLLRRGMVKPSCVLDWPVHKERIPAFQQKLRLALAASNRVE